MIIVTPLLRAPFLTSAKTDFIFSIRRSRVLKNRNKNDALPESYGTHNRNTDVKIV